MMFRKLNWVAEELQSSGASEIRGVFTSIPNLVHHGLECGYDLSRCRLTLTRLDCDGGPIASWCGERLSRMGDDLEQFVDTEDISEDQRLLLVRWICGHMHLAA